MDPYVRCIACGFLAKWATRRARRPQLFDLEGNVLSRAAQLFLNNEIVVIEGKVVFKPGMKTLLRDFAGDR